MLFRSIFLASVLRRFTVGLLTLLIGVWAPSARAEDEADPTTRARVLYLKGNAAFKRGDDAQARKYYTASLALRESFDTFCNLGRAEEISGALADAYYHLGLCLKYYPQDEELGGPREKYAALHEDVGGRLSPEEMVAVDARVADHELTQQDDAEPAATTAGTGATVVTAPALGPTEPPPAIDPGLDEAPRRSAWRLPVTLTMGVLGAAGVGIGTGFLVDAGDKRDQGGKLRSKMIDDGISCPKGGDNHPSCSLLAKLYDQADGRRTTGVVLAASGGALLVGSVLLYVLWPEQKARPRAQDGQSTTLVRTERPPTPLSFAEVVRSTWRPEIQFAPQGGFSWGISGKF